MSTYIGYANAQHVDIDGAAGPGQIQVDTVDWQDRGTVSTNRVACIRIRSQFSGEGFAIEGRPSDLLKVAQEIVAIARQISYATYEDPSLMLLYGNEP